MFLYALYISSTCFISQCYVIRDLQIPHSMQHSCVFFLVFALCQIKTRTTWTDCCIYQICLRHLCLCNIPTSMTITCTVVCVSRVWLTKNRTKRQSALHRTLRVLHSWRYEWFKIQFLLFSCVDGDIELLKCRPWHPEKTFIVSVLWMLQLFQFLI